MELASTVADGTAVTLASISAAQTGEARREHGPCCSAWSANAARRKAAPPVAVADAGNHCVRMVRGRAYRPEELERDARVMPDGAAVAHWSPHCMNHDRLITIAGRPKAPGSADSHASAQGGGLDSPSSVLQLPTGELLVADTGNHTIRLLVTTAKRPWVHGWDAPAVGGWRLSTVAGRAGEAGCVDGEQQENDVTRGGAVRLREPTGLCRTADGAILFVTRSGDDDEGAVRQLIPIGEAAARKWGVRTLYGGRPLSRLTGAAHHETLTTLKVGRHLLILLPEPQGWVVIDILHDAQNLTDRDFDQEEP